MQARRSSSTFCFNLEVSKNQGPYAALMWTPDSNSRTPIIRTPTKWNRTLQKQPAHLALIWASGSRARRAGQGSKCTPARSGKCRQQDQPPWLPRRLQDIFDASLRHLRRHGDVDILTCFTHPSFSGLLLRTYIKLPT